MGTQIKITVAEISKALKQGRVWLSHRSETGPGRTGIQIVGVRAGSRRGSPDVQLEGRGKRLDGWWRIPTELDATVELM